MSDLRRLAYENATMSAALIVIAVAVAVGMEVLDMVFERITVDLHDDLWFALLILGVMLAARAWRNVGE